jgi:hypothetical protein
MSKRHLAASCMNDATAFPDAAGCRIDYGGEWLPRTNKIFLQGRIEP